MVIDYRQHGTARRRPATKESRSSRRRLRTLREQVRYNLDAVQQHVVGTSRISRDDLIVLLKLRAVAPSRCTTDRSRDASADNDMQWIQRKCGMEPVSIGGVKFFDAADTVRTLGLFASGKIG